MRKLVFLTAIAVAAGAGYRLLARPHDAARGAPSEVPGVFPIYDPAAPCGPVAVAVVDSLLAGVDASAIDLRTVAVSSPSGVSSLDDVVEGLKARGYAAAPVLLADISRCPYRVVGPVVVHLKPGHFAVALVTPNASVVLIDRYRAVVVSRADFDRRWSGHAILLGRTEQDLAVRLSAAGVASSVPVRGNKE